MIRKFALAAVLAVVATVGVTAPALADEEPITGAEMPFAAPARAEAQDAANRAQLDALVGTQTQKEIAAILNSGEPAQSLYDPVTNEYLAAFIEEPTFVTQAIHLRGPGCAAGDACANNVIGYYGTGQLTFPSPYTSITKIYAGDKATTWWRTATAGNFLNPGATLNFTSPVTMVSITRS